jgi:hypothetical protein
MSMFDYDARPATRRDASAPAAFSGRITAILVREILGF